MLVQALRDAVVAVTGGSGFIGRRLVARLLAPGPERLVVLDRRPPHGAPNVDARVLDLGTASPEELDAALDGVTHVFHFAAEKHSARADPRAIHRTNVRGTEALFEAAHRNGVRKIVFASSLYAYGRDRGAPLEEEETPRPTTPYGVSKLTGERIGAALAASGGPEFVALRYFFAYGPGQIDEGERPSLLTSTFARLHRGEAPVVNGDGTQALDYVFVEDVVDATVLAMESPETGDVFNVGSGQAPTVNDLVRRMQAIAGTAFEPVRAPSDATDGTSRIASVARAEARLGFRATTTLDEGLARVWEAVLRAR